VKEALSLLGLNSYLKEHLVTPSFKRVVVMGLLRACGTEAVSEHNFTQVLRSEFGITANSFVVAYEKLRSTVNLIINPFGEDGFSNWTKHSQGRNGWAIET
jgi:hypothetical protein